MAVKRRIIWVDDETWAGLTTAARDAGTNPSRYLIGLLPGTPKSLENKEVTDKALRQAERDAILRKINKR